MSFFENFIQIFVLLIAWLVVVVAFFILAVQLFVTLIEFKLTTLAGFVLVPFGLFNKTAFLAERVLGNVVASGVKVLVLAVIVGIGTTLFGEFTQGFGGNQPSLEDALAPRAGGAVASRSRHLRPRNCDRPDGRRAAAWRRRGGRDGARRRRSRRRRRHGRCALGRGRSSAQPRASRGRVRKGLLGRGKRARRGGAGGRLPGRASCVASKP